jgi:hypothetical protein
MADALQRRLDGEVVDPAAMAVEADQRRGDDDTAFAADEQGRIRCAPRPRDIGARVGVGMQQAAARPQVEHRRDVAVFDCADDHGSPPRR